MVQASPQSDFLRLVYGRLVPPQRLQLWNLRTKRSYAATSVDDAASYADDNPVDTYVAVGTAPMGAMLPERGRIAATQVGGLGAFWIDLDVIGGPADKDVGFATKEDAVAAVAELLPATILVDSGWGIHAWWVFDDPLLITTPAARETAAAQARQWQDAMRVVAGETHIDSTHDLARIMRLPGTANGKGGLDAPVLLLSADGPTYPLERFVERADELGAPAKPAAPIRSNGASRYEIEPGLEIAYRPEASPPHDRYEALRENHDDFRRTWDGDRRLPGTDQSPSAYALSIANYCAHAGWTPQEIADTLIAYHRKRGTKQDRPDYIARTVAKALERSERTMAREAAEEAREAALEELAHMQDEPNVAPKDALAMFNVVLASGQPAAPKVESIVQYGREEERTRYVLTFVGGDELQITATTLLDSKAFRRAVMTQTAHVMTIPEAKDWIPAVRVLVRAAQVTEDPEDTLGGDLAAVLRSYVDLLGAPSRVEERDARCEARHPYRDDNGLWIAADDLLRWVTANRSPWRKADLLAALRRAGFRQQTVSYVRVVSGVEKRTTASYFNGPLEAAGLA